MCKILMIILNFILNYFILNHMFEIMFEWFCFSRWNFTDPEQHVRKSNYGDGKKDCECARDGGGRNWGAPLQVCLMWRSVHGNSKTRGTRNGEPCSTNLEPTSSESDRRHHRRLNPLVDKFFIKKKYSRWSEWFTNYCSSLIHSFLF